MNKAHHSIAARVPAVLILFSAAILGGCETTGGNGSAAEGYRDHDYSTPVVRDVDLPKNDNLKRSMKAESNRLEYQRRYEAQQDMRRYERNRQEMQLPRFDPPTPSFRVR